MVILENKSLYAVVIAGGRGKRFWPLSRDAKPKQLLSLTGSKPLLRETVDRILPLVPKERLLVVTNKSHADGVREVLDGIPSENILVEPEGKNTAPAIALAAAHLMERDRDAVMLALPSDHIISTPDRLLKEIAVAVDISLNHNLLVTFGIRPSRPETGYGYIEVGGKIDRTVFKVLSFKEKPNRKKAKDYVDSGHYLWNSGMFVFKCSLLMSKIESLLPDLYFAWKAYRESPKGADDLQKYYDGVDSVSIDYGVMEKSGDASAVISSSIKWSDVGSWQAIDEVWKADEQDNRHNEGELISISSQGNTVVSKKLVALLGVEGLMVVETDDALLICKKERSQEIKSIVSEIERRGLKKYL